MLPGRRASVAKTSAGLHKISRRGRGQTSTVRSVAAEGAPLYLIDAAEVAYAAQDI